MCLAAHSAEVVPRAAPISAPWEPPKARLCVLVTLEVLKSPKQWTNLGYLCSPNNVEIVFVVWRGIDVRHAQWQKKVSQARWSP